MRHRLDTGKSRLQNYVQNGAEALPRLPLVHTTDAYALGVIVENEELVPQACPVFTGEQLTYLFYGRPAFRPNLNAEPTDLKHYFPVCIIFRPEWTAKIRRIFPFDSGGFHNDFYLAHLHRHMKLGDFGLEADMSTPGKVISRFHGSVADYLLGTPTKTPEPDPSEFEAHSYLSLINARGSNAVDSRGGGIELQIDQIIDIKEAVAAVILPSTFASTELGKKLDGLSIDLLPYRAYDRFRPTEYMAQINDLVFGYYLRLDLISSAELDGIPS